MVSPFDIAWSVLKGDPRLLADANDVTAGSIQPVVAQMIDRRVQSGEIEPSDWNDFMGRPMAGSWIPEKTPRSGKRPSVGGYNQDRVPLTTMSAAVGEPTQERVNPAEVGRSNYHRGTRYIRNEKGKLRRVMDRPNVQPMVDRTMHARVDSLTDGSGIGDMMETQAPPAGSDQEAIEQSPFFDKYKTDAGDERGYKESHPTATEERSAKRQERISRRAPLTTEQQRVAEFLGMTRVPHGAFGTKKRTRY